MLDAWSVEQECGRGEGGFIRLIWVLISAFEVLVAPPRRGFVPLELCSRVHLFLHSLHLPYFTRFLIRKDIVFRTIVILAEGAGEGI